MPISASDIVVGSVIIDTDYDYNLIYEIEDQKMAYFYVIRGPNTGTSTKDTIDVITEGNYYTEKVGQVALRDVESMIRIMNLVDKDWTARKIHVS